MLNRVYQFLGVMVLSGYAWSSYSGMEFTNPLVVRTAPPINAVIGPASRGFTGRSTAVYRTPGSYSSGTRSGWGIGGLGGK